MKISIIIPTYNVEPYIIECLQSVASQTYRGGMECIIVDDCGTDNSIAVAEEWIKGNGYKLKVYDKEQKTLAQSLTSNHSSLTFIIVHREKNGGLSAARNSGFDVATGEYVFFLDSDDYIEPFTIEKMVETANQYHEAEVIQAGIKTNKGNVSFDAENISGFDILSDKKTLQKKLIMPSELPVSSWNKLIKRSFLVENGIRFYEGIIHEDVDYIYKIADKISSLAVCKANTYVYRVQREGSILNTTNSERSLHSRLQIYNSILDNIKNIDNKVLARSLFLRGQYVLLSPPSSKELLNGLKVLCNRIVSSSSNTDKVIMKIYFSLPNILQRQGRVYRFFNNYFN